MFRISFQGSRTREAAKQRVSSYLFCIYRPLQTPRPSEKAQKLSFLSGVRFVFQGALSTLSLFLERDPRQGLYLKMSQRHCFKFYLPPAHNAFPPFSLCGLGRHFCGFFFQEKNRNGTTFINRAFQRWTKQNLYIAFFGAFVVLHKGTNRGQCCRKRFLDWSSSTKKLFILELKCTISPDKKVPL